MAEIPRSQAKVINLGFVYGMGKVNSSRVRCIKDKAENYLDKISFKSAICKTVNE